MKFKKILICITLLSNITKAEYIFNFEPIDVVIPCHEKDTTTLEYVIKGARENVKNLNKIYIISKDKLTDNAIWINENIYPFSKYDLALEIFKNKKQAQEFINHPKSRIGWIFQQFLKLYSPIVIPNISSNVLIIDADTVFLRPIEFQDKSTGAGLYNPGTEYHKPYFDHLKRVLPGFKKVFPQHSGISHHMLFQRIVIEDILNTIQNTHKNEPWKVFCDKIDKKEIFFSCMCIEYELYFNFVFEKSNLVKIRYLNWANIASLNFDYYRKHKFDFVSSHSYMRNKINNLRILRNKKWSFK